MCHCYRRFGRVLESVKINTSNNEFSLCWSVITVYFTNPGGGVTESTVTNFKRQVVRGVGVPTRWVFVNCPNVLFCPSLQPRPAVWFSSFVHHWLTIWWPVVTFCNLAPGAKQINHLTPNDPYMGRTAPLTSKRCILYIYSTNIGTEYFKHAL